MNTYRIYGYTNKGYELVGTTTDREKALKKAKNLNSHKYHRYMIIEHDYARDEDILIAREYLGEECIVRHTDYVPDFRVVGTEMNIKEKKEIER